MTPMYSRFIYDFSRPVDDFKSFCKALPNIEMICAFFANDDELAECKQKIAACEDLICAQCEKYNVEIFSKNAGKGNALLRLARHLGIDRGETIAVGDSPNDETMLRAAGLGLAMGNAWDELLPAADAQICTNEQHAIKYILENYIDKK